MSGCFYSLKRLYFRFCCLFFSEPSRRPDSGKVYKSAKSENSDLWLNSNFAGALGIFKHDFDDLVVQYLVTSKYIYKWEGKTSCQHVYMTNLALTFFKTLEQNDLKKWHCWKCDIYLLTLEVVMFTCILLKLMYLMLA